MTRTPGISESSVKAGRNAIVEKVTEEVREVAVGLGRRKTEILLGGGGGILNNHAIRGKKGCGVRK